METEIRVQDDQGQAYTVGYIATPTTWEVVDETADDYVSVNARVYQNNLDLGTTPTSPQVEANLFDDLAVKHYTKVATIRRHLIAEGLLDHEMIELYGKTWSLNTIAEIIKSDPKPTLEDKIMGTKIKKECVKRHEFFVEAGSFMGCDERLGFSNFSSGCFYNYI
tara:strand:+ start:65 stop:559 length:495 start_codon:yes stop_codon:yes gene_type:complete